MGYYKQEYEVNEKSGGSPVTEADYHSERIIIDELKGLDYGIIGEETGLVDGNEDDGYWIVDPLDGTQDFIDKTGEFSIMVGFLHKGDPVFGVVYAPELEKLWYGLHDNGAYKIENRKTTQLHVTGNESLNDFRLIASRNHFGDTDKMIAEELNVKSITRMGSLGIKFSSIAEGISDLTYYTTDRLGIWDVCAPQVILEEAGGKALDVNGKPLTYDLKTRRMANGVVGIGTRNIGVEDKIVNILKGVNL